MSKQRLPSKLGTISGRGEAPRDTKTLREKMGKSNIKIIKDKDAPESAELLAKSIVQVSEASQQILDAGLTKRALILLLQDLIGPAKINRTQIELVLDNLPRLKAWYVKK